MRKAILFTLLFIPVFCFGQKLVKNEVDEFTGISVKTTSLEQLVSESPWGGNSFHLSESVKRINDNYYLIVRFSLDNVFSVASEQKLMIKLENDSIVTLLNKEYDISSNGRGAIGGKQGVYLTYPIESDDLDLLKENKATKIRIYTTDGYLEKDIKEKNQDKIKKCIELVSN
jgi:hypothetical protein